MPRYPSSSANGEYAALAAAATAALKYRRRCCAHEDESMRGARSAKSVTRYMRRFFFFTAVRRNHPSRATELSTGSARAKSIESSMRLYYTDNAFMSKEVKCLLCGLLSRRALYANLSVPMRKSAHTMSHVTAAGVAGKMSQEDMVKDTGMRRAGEGRN